jgi:invasion protein IalB
LALATSVGVERAIGPPEERVVLRRMVLPVLLAAAVLVAPTFAGAPGHAQERAPFPSPVAEMGGRMSLGLRAERFRPEDVEGNRPARGDQCRKWRRMADRLGETFAGHTLRHSVLRDVCGLFEAERPDEAWDWPWSSLARGRVLPPRHLRTHGAWEVRCGAAGKRRRCALVALLDGPVLRLPDGGAEPPVAHFVIDRVAGRESLLWRVFVPADRGTAVTVLGGREAGIVNDMSAAAPIGKGTVRYKIGEREYAERFPVCAEAGCIMEANVASGGAVATRLWDGQAVDLAIESSSGRRLDLQLPAVGFRAAFADLMRLRREERRAR